MIRNKMQEILTDGTNNSEELLPDENMNVKK